MGFLAGKRVLIVGVASKLSIASGIAAAMHREGAELALGFAINGLIALTPDGMPLLGETPVLLTSPAIRPFVRSVIERFRAATTVMSQAEIHAKAQIKTLGQI